MWRTGYKIDKSFVFIVLFLIAVLELFAAKIAKWSCDLIWVMEALGPHQENLGNVVVPGSQMGKQLFHQYR